MPKVNAIMTVAVLQAILAGVAVAGFVLGHNEGAWYGGREGREVVMFAAMAGALFSLGVPHFSAASPQKKFPVDRPGGHSKTVVFFPE